MSINIYFRTQQDTWNLGAETAKAKESLVNYNRETALTTRLMPSFNSNKVLCEYQLNNIFNKYVPHVSEISKQHEIMSKRETFDLVQEFNTSTQELAKIMPKKFDWSRVVYPVSIMGGTLALNTFVPIVSLPLRVASYAMSFFSIARSATVPLLGSPIGIEIPFDIHGPHFDPSKGITPPPRIPLPKGINS